MTATMGASMTTSAIPGDNVSAWNYEPGPALNPAAVVTFDGITAPVGG